MGSDTIGEMLQQRSREIVQKNVDFYKGTKECRINESEED